MSIFITLVSLQAPRKTRPWEGGRASGARRWSVRALRQSWCWMGTMTLSVCCRRKRWTTWQVSQLIHNTQCNLYDRDGSLFSIHKSYTSVSWRDTFLQSSGLKVLCATWVWIKHFLAIICYVIEIIKSYSNIPVGLPAQRSPARGTWSEMSA